MRKQLPHPPVVDYEALLDNGASVPAGKRQLNVCRTTKCLVNLFPEVVLLIAGTELKIDQRSTQGVSRQLSPVLGMCCVTLTPPGQLRWKGVLTYRSQTRSCNTVEIFWSCCNITLSPGK